MERKIFCLILAFFMTTALFAMSPFSESDFYTMKQREAIITKRILKCKDVVDVQVSEYGDEVSKATITITLTNDRLLVLQSSGIRLEFKYLLIVKVGEFNPSVLKYYISQEDSHSRLIELNVGPWLKASYVKYLNPQLESVNDIESLIENYNLIYSSLPVADETLPKCSYWEPISGNEIYCKEWEQLENPHFYKTETEGGKFYKMTEDAFKKYRDKLSITSNTIE